MRSMLITSLCMLVSTVCHSQQTYYDVTAGAGNGIRFWSSDAYKIHMGSSSEYQYGPVTNYSIKSNIGPDTGMGWTWGGNGVTPVAALSNGGEFAIASHMSIGSPTASNNGGWARVLDVYGSQHSKILATSDNNKNIRMGMYSHTTWVSGGGGFVGPESNHNLYLVANSAPMAVLTTGGFFGVGTLTPTQALDVAGIVAIRGVKVINTGNSSNGSDIYINSRVIRNESTTLQDGMYINYNSTGGSNANLMFFANGSNERMRISAATGNVGIGTTAPDAKLTVKGQVHAQEVKVDMNGPVAPDYVFDKNHALPSLETIKSYIEQNHHLPEVPSAKEFEEKGINVGEMNMLLLKKVEELTLHILQQEERIKALESKSK